MQRNGLTQRDPNDRQIEAIAEQVFSALADPNRRVILTELASYGARTATELTQALSISRQGITKHLGLLAEAGLVLAAPGAGRRVYYRLSSAPIQIAQTFLAALARDWDSPLKALEQHLDRNDSSEGKKWPKKN